MDLGQEDPSQNGSRRRPDSDDDAASAGLRTDSSASSLFGSDDCPSASSSGDISGSSGEIPAAVVVEAVVPNLLLDSAAAQTYAGSPAKERCVGRGKAVAWGSAELVGRRKEMEDAVAVVPGFMSRTCDGLGGCTAAGSRCSSEIGPVHFFGVYDGHGGSQVAKFCAERIHEAVAAEWDQGADEEGWCKRWKDAFLNGFDRVDNDIGGEAIAPEIVGSTAVAVVLSGCQIIASNCGDSRAILCRGNQTIPLTIDHKPDRADELLRIEGGGGRVINWNGPRVFGVLAMSRAIGDRYLRPWIIPVPEVTFTARSEEDECLIVASDGLWDVMTNEEAGEVARIVLRRHRRSTLMDENSLPAAQAAAEHLAELAYRKNSSDNISVIVVDLKPKRKRQQRQ
ncbi:putative protein phosphatase 2C 6 [Cinnamomum micranthum f. kanehirae]|uniref:protein-serine/threonine phosphatase n=1 Tax=Cinnamomum micranthum f. kanehirae TaxID=337451 RepID=A0A443N4T4_9MAGN|nr:putative protein phosphatase 2C 6 [Cinnamomum micranthum f. kanehirae]